MENFIKITREYKGISFRYTKGNIDVFQTKQFHPFYELYFLLSHGLMHLLGFDHQTEEEYNFVIEEQRKALGYIEYDKI